MRPFKRCLRRIDGGWNQRVRKENGRICITSPFRGLTGTSTCRSANLKGAHLLWSDLEGANLKDADIRGAHFLDTRLRLVDLRGANLKEATGFTGKQISSAITDERTRLVRTTFNNPNLYYLSTLFSQYFNVKTPLPFALHHAPGRGPYHLKGIWSLTVWDTP